MKKMRSAIQQYDIELPKVIYGFKTQTTNIQYRYRRLQWYIEQGNNWSSSISTMNEEAISFTIDRVVRKFPHNMVDTKATFFKWTVILVELEKLPYSIWWWWGGGPLITEMEINEKEINSCIGEIGFRFFLQMSWRWWF